MFSKFDKSLLYNSIFCVSLISKFGWFVTTIAGLSRSLKICKSSSKEDCWDKTMRFGSFKFGFRDFSLVLFSFIVLVTVICIVNFHRMYTVCIIHFFLALSSLVFVMLVAGYLLSLCRHP